MVSHSKLVPLCLLVVMGSVLPATPIARADGPRDLLELVPEDAWGFVVFRSLKNIDAKISLLNEQLGISIPQAQMGVMMLGVGDTLDATKPVGAVMMDVNKFGGSDSAVVLYIPAANAKALLEALGAEEPTEGVHTCMVAGQPAFAATKGKFVLLSPSKDCLMYVLKAEKTLAKGMDKARLAAMDKSDLYLSVSVSALMRAYGDMLSMITQMTMAATDPGGRSAERLMKMFKEIASLDVSVRVDKNGVSVGLLTAPKKESDLEAIWRETKNTDEALLSVLPKEQYLFAAGGTYKYSKAQEKFRGVEQIMAMVKGLGAEESDAEALKTLEAGLEHLIKSCGNWALSVSALPPGPGGMIGLTCVLGAEDPKAFVADLRKVYKAGMNLVSDEDVKAITKHIVLTPDAESIAGRKVDTLTVNVPDLAKSLDGSEEWSAKLAKVIGEDVSIRFGAVGDKHVAIAFGGGKDRFEAICRSVKSGGGLSTDEGIAKVSAALPSPRSSEWFIAVDNIVRMVKGIAKATGEEGAVPIDVPAVNAPLAISTVQRGRIVQSDLVVPMKLLTAAKALIDSMGDSGIDDFDEDEDEEAGEDKDDDTPKEEAGTKKNKEI